MLTSLLIIAILSGLLLLYPVARAGLATTMGPGDGPLAAPMVLVAVFAFMPLVFSIDREAGTAVLEEGLTASNIVTIVLTGLTGLYLAGRLLADRRILLIAFAMPYLPFTLMIVVNGLTALWSIVPAYTLYRTVELAIFYLASILIFDRGDISRRLADLLAFFIAVWLLAVSPIIVTSLAAGILFSAAKNNMMPLVCTALALLMLFGPRHPRRTAYLLLAIVGFVIAGSAASTGALLGIVPAVMIASRHRPVRVTGWVLAAATTAVFLFLIVGLSAFPELLEALSVVLQKPAEELANATGRTTFWPTFIEATRGRLFGSGFSAADRFVQLLIPTSALADTLGREEVFITSSHNMFLSAWAGSGMLGIAFAGITLLTAIRWGLKLDAGGRRMVVGVVLVLVLNGMTTPGIFQDWNVHVLVFVAVLAYARIGAAPEARTLRAPLRLLQPAQGGWRTS